MLKIAIGALALTGALSMGQVLAAKQTTESVGQEAKQAGEATKQGAEELGRATEEGTKKAAEATEKGAEKAGEATEESVKRAGEELDEAGERAKREIDEGTAKARQELEGGEKSAEPSATTPPDPQAIADSLENRLTADPQLRGAVIEVEADTGGTVTLTGTVPGQTAHKRALEVAHETPGVQDVRDQLEMKTPRP